MGSASDSPIDDLTYDVITVLQNKAKALDAYDKYLRDAYEDDEAREAFEAMRRHDQEDVRMLKEILARRLDEDLGFVDDEYDDEEGEEEDEGYEAAIEEEEDGAASQEPPRRGESRYRHGHDG